MKKIISLLLAFFKSASIARTASMFMAAAMSVTLIGALPAAAETEYQYDDFPKSYFDTSLSNWLLENGYSADEEYYVSCPIEYSDYSTGEVNGVYAFVFQNDDIIAKLRTYEYDGSKYIVLDESVPAEVQLMYDNKEHVAITYYEDYTFIVSETDSAAFDVDEKVTMDKHVGLTSQIEKVKEVIVASPMQTRSSSLGSYTIQGINFVPNVAVTNIHVTNQYVLCWEACLAMKVNYLTNRNLTAMQVYQAIGCPDPHDGNVINDQTYIDTYAMYGVSVNHYNTTIPTSTLLQELRNDNPIDLDAQDLNKKGLYHTILLYGLHVYSDHTDFYLLDPDYQTNSGRATVTVTGQPNTSHNNFVYNTSYHGHAYQWYQTRY